jgi:hypothetical protein
MLLMTSQHPQRRRRSGPRSAASAVAAQRSALTDDAAEGTPATDAQPCLFNTFTRSNLRVSVKRHQNAHFPLSR